MKKEVLDLEFSENFLKYEEAQSNLKQIIDNLNNCIRTYESLCKKLIIEISTTEYENAKIYFDELEEIQVKLSKLYFHYGFLFNNEMQILIRAFDSLYSDSTREFWYKKIQSGMLWPESL